MQAQKAQKAHKKHKNANKWINDFFPFRCFLSAWKRCLFCFCSLICVLCFLYVWNPSVKKKQTALMISLTLLLALLNPDQISCWISLFIQPLLPDCSFITVKSNVCHLLLYQLKLFMNAYWMFIISIYWKRHNSRIVKTKVCSRLQTSNQYSSITKNDKFLPLIIRGVIKTPPKTLWRIVLQE